LTILDITFAFAHVQFINIINIANLSYCLIFKIWRTS